MKNFILLGFCFAICGSVFGQNSALEKSVQSIDWRKMLSMISNNQEFQGAVRQCFSSLKPEAQQRVTMCVAAMRELKRFEPTGSPVDPLIVKHLSAVLSPLVTDSTAKAELAQITEAGDLPAMLAVLEGRVATSPAIDEVATQDTKRTAFLNCTWVTEAKTQFKFLPKGKGTQFKAGKETNFEWRASGNVVTADFGKNRFIYFTFSPKESFFGVLRTQINQPLTKQ